MPPNTRMKCVGEDGSVVGVRGVRFYLTRVIVMRGMAAIYLCAFISNYIQWPGLFSCAGLEPVYTHLWRVSSTHGPARAVEALPTLAWLHSNAWIGVDIDVWCDVLLLMGIVISFLVLVSGSDSGWLFLLLWCLYSSIQAVGQTFLSFQWDILLLESGLIIALLGRWTLPRFDSIIALCTQRSAAHEHDEEEENGELAGRISSGPRKDMQAVHTAKPTIIRRLLHPFLPSLDPSPTALPSFLIRWLLFRLMFASGVVKVLSGCQTWGQELSALQYHYATQCIPTPLAWVAHQLHPAIQQFSVAMTLWIESVAALLILLPVSIPFFSFPRQVGILLQLLLQVAIILTGNYTFFNWLTILLISALVTDGEWRTMGRVMTPWKWNWCGARKREKQGVTHSCTHWKDEQQNAQTTHDKDKHVSSTSNSAGKKNMSQQRASEVEMATTASSPSSPSVSVQPTKVSPAQPTPSPIRPHSSSFLIRLAYSLARLIFRLAFLAALMWSFTFFYRIDFIRVRPSRRSSPNVSFTKWDALPDLHSLTIREWPYAALIYIYYFCDIHKVKVSPNYSAKDVQRWMDEYLTYIVAWAAILAATIVIMTFTAIIRHAYRKYKRDTLLYSHQHNRRCICLRRFFVRLVWLSRVLGSFLKFSVLCLICCLVFASSIPPFMQPLSRSALLSLPPLVRHRLHAAYQHLQPFHVTNSYGLFRQMTGVGPMKYVEEEEDVDVWIDEPGIDGGTVTPTSSSRPGKRQKVKRAVTQVHRPELIIYGSHSPDGRGSWHELKFRYKPNGDYSEPPRWVAPHQPRLDWQMWFAALSPSPAPWLVHLVWKLLEGDSDPATLYGKAEETINPVWALLDPKGIHPFTPASPPLSIRVEKRTIDFTRLQGCDGGRNPKPKSPSHHSTSHPHPHRHLSIPRAWWSETAPASDFLPPLDSSNPSVQNFLAQTGWIQVCSKMRAEMIRMRSKETKERIFEPIEQAEAEAEAEAEAAAGAETERTTAVVTNRSSNRRQGPASSLRSPRFPRHARWWELSYYLSWLESHLPLPRSYAPYARRIKSLTLEARRQLQQFSTLTWREWMRENTIIHMAITTILIVILGDALIRW